MLQRFVIFLVLFLGRLAVALLVLLLLSPFIIRLFDIDPDPIVINIARFLSSGRMIEFDEAFVTNAAQNPRVCAVHRLDTDGDGFREWLVFYQVDVVGPRSWRQPCPDESPRLGAVYDNDRGAPPILFPYNLTPPNRDLLGEEGVTYQTAEIVANRSDRNAPIEELLIYGHKGGVDNQLTIFKFQQNTLAWEPPRDNPPRYQVIGAFRGSGGVAYDPQTKEVIVYDSTPFQRSQLAVKNVYALHGGPGEETYMTFIDSKELAAPVESTIDFALGPPSDILNTEFPEKIVLAFYQSLDRNRSRSLPQWDSASFLASNGNAAENLQADNLAYFFAQDNSSNLNIREVNDLAVLQVEYFPAVEENPVTETYAGKEPRFGRVDIQVATREIPRVAASYEMVLAKGQWKINRRLQ